MVRDLSKSQCQGQSREDTFRDLIKRWAERPRRGPGRFCLSLPQSYLSQPHQGPPPRAQWQRFFFLPRTGNARAKNSKEQTTKQKPKGRLMAYSEQPARLVLFGLHFSLYLLLLIILLLLSAFRGLQVPLGLLLRGLHLPVCQPLQNCSRVFCLKAD